MKNKPVPLPLLTIMIFASIFNGCSTSKRFSKFRLSMNDDYCISNINGNFTEIEPYCHRPDSLFSHDTLLNRHFSKNEILVANAIGSIPIIRDLLTNLRDQSTSATVNRLE